MNIKRTVKEVAKNIVNKKPKERVFQYRKATVQMLGRFQPFHDGHLALFKKCHSKTGQVCIMVRTLNKTKTDPYAFKDIKHNIKMHLLGDGYEEGKDFIIRQVPNIVNVSYGRRVGYIIEEHRFDDEVENISSTEIRRQLGIEKN